MDTNVRKMKKSPFLLTKDRGRAVSRLRFPGGGVRARHLPVLQKIAEEYGDGVLHIHPHQTIEIPGIAFEDMPRVNELLQTVADDLDLNQEGLLPGQSAAATRNVCACIGSRVCPYACYDTAALARRIEREVFPNTLHFNIALTGCHADCAGVRQFDFGVIGMTLPRYDPARCVDCGACVKACRRNTAALTGVNHKIVRDHRRCIGCGDCVIACPTSAWTRSPEKYFRLVLMGRSGKRNPRPGENFIKWADEESVVGIIRNSREFVLRNIDRRAPGGKEHIGHIIDRVGFEEYRKIALAGITLPEVAEVRKTMYWGGVTY